MTIDLDELERLAKAAGSGPWKRNDECVYDSMGDAVADVYSSLDANADFIAATNPETVLALVKRVRELEKEYQEECARTSRAEDLLRDALESDLGWEDTEWGPKAAKIVGKP